MASKKKQAEQAGEQSQFPVEVSVNGEQRVFLESVPEGFPPSLLPHLADFWKRGFSAAHERRPDPDAHQSLEVPSLAGLAAPNSGRPVNDEVEQLARQAAILRRQVLTYGTISLRVCDKRGDPHHRCSKKCADRIRQAVKALQTREELDRLSRGE